LTPERLTNALRAMRASVALKAVADTHPAPNTMLAAVEGGMIFCESDVEVFARSLERP